MKKAFIYIRNSTPSQKRKKTQINQEVEIKEFLKNNSDIEIVNQFNDLGRSGANPDREGFNEMISRLNEITHIIVYDLDRIARDLNIGLDFMRYCHKANITILEVSSGRAHNLSQSFDQLSFFLGIWRSEQEWIKRKETQKLGIERYKRTHGKWGKNIVYGYNINGKPLSEEAFIKEITQMKAKSNSKMQMARNLNVHVSTIYNRLRELRVKGIVI